MEIVRFAFARLDVLEYTKKEMIDFYNSIPNRQNLTADEIVDLCWDSQTNQFKNTIAIKIGVPDAEQITCEAELDAKIADYFRQNA